MSGVAALLSLDGSPVREEEWSPIAAKLGEFGRDRQWHWKERSVVLLRALDERTPSDTHAHGPATTADWVVVGDVRLDARDDLSRALELSPAEAAMLPDEQLFVLALAKWGPDAPTRLQGGFGVIAWERSSRQLHLWRDANGERPLYFYRLPRRLLVASRPPVLFTLPGVSREVDLAGLVKSVAYRRPPFHAPLKGVQALRTGAHHTFDPDGRQASHPYWAPPDLWAWTRTKTASPVEELREVLTEAISDRLRTLGPKGGFCSGGLDSTSIAALAASTLKRQGEDYLAFTSVPHPDWKEPPASSRWENDETPYVRALTERHPNIQTAFVAMDGGISLDCLPTLFRETASPASGSNLPWALAIRERMRAAGIRIPFVGGGGNASFSLDSEILWDLLRAGRLDLLAREFRASPAEFLNSSRTLLRGAKARIHRHRRKALVWLSKDVTAQFAGQDSEAHLPCLANSRRRFSEIYDAMQGANYSGLERLVPARDRRVVELCRRLPPQEFRHGSERRRLIRRAMAGLLPDSIRLRETRGAQAPDYWMHVSKRREDLRTAVEFVGEDVFCSAAFDMTALRSCLKDWPDGYDPAFVKRLWSFETTLSMGLYARWIHDRLDDLPGVRPLRSFLV